HVPFISIQTFVMSTASICGTAGLPLPSGERVGGRGNQPLDRKPPHPTPLPSGEREQAVLAAYPGSSRPKPAFRTLANATSVFGILPFLFASSSSASSLDCRSSCTHSR